MTRTHIITAVAIIEAIVIACLVTTNKRLLIVRPSPVPASQNPLRLAIEYQSPDDKFEELARRYPDLVTQRTGLQKPFTTPILADCAVLKLTNYVRILIANGANLSEAIKSLREIGADDALNLIQQVQSENISKSAP